MNICDALCKWSHGTFAHVLLGLFTKYNVSKIHSFIHVTERQRDFPVFLSPLPTFSPFLSPTPLSSSRDKTQMWALCTLSKQSTTELQSLNIWKGILLCNSCSHQTCHPFTSTSVLELKMHNSIPGYFFHDKTAFHFISVPYFLVYTIFC